MKQYRDEIGSECDIENCETCIEHAKIADIEIIPDTTD